MKLSNLLQLTEHHRYVVIRRFGLGPLDSRMLWSAYQPMIGGFAASLYHTLYTAFSTDMVGVSDPAPLRQLFLCCGLEPNEKGRKRLVEETSKLEAVGLLQTVRRFDGDEVVEYEFRLQPPLRPDLFFGIHHLWLLLQEKVGVSAAETVRRSFLRESWSAGPEEVSEDISSPFYEVFRISVPVTADTGDAAGMAAAAKEAAAGTGASGEFGRDGFRSSELLQRFPRSSPNRRFVERLLADAEQLAALNFYAGRCELSLKQTVSLLDEEGMFDRRGVWEAERFQARAADMYAKANVQEQTKDLTVRKQELARSEAEPETGANEARPPGQERDVTAPYWLEVPEQFQGQCDVRQYNAMLANSPYTRVLKLFFQPSAVPKAVEEAFMAMNINYQLPDEVINVMIHYIRVNDLDWKRKYLDAIGANVAGKRIRSFENAVVYFRKAEQSRSGAAGAGNAGTGRGEGVVGGSGPAGAGTARKSDARRGRPPTKPVIPVAKSADKPDATEEDIKRIMEMAKRLTNG